MSRPKLLVSIHSRHAETILRGDKRVELRRKAPRCAIPADVLLYATRPVGAVVGRCRFDAVISGSARDVWRSAGARACVTRDEFDAYFAGQATTHALVIADPEPTVRAALPFRAPQSFQYLRVGVPEHRSLLALFLPGGTL